MSMAGDSAERENSEYEYKWGLFIYDVPGSKSRIALY